MPELPHQRVQILDRYDITADELLQVRLDIGDKRFFYPCANAFCFSAYCAAYPSYLLAELPLGIS